MNESIPREFKERDDFFTRWFNYTRGTEVPTFFYRWSAITGLGAWLGRDVHLKFGDTEIYPNMFVILMGEPGTKKSTAIKKMKKLLARVGYNKFSAEKTSKEKFLLDLGGVDDSGDPSGDDFLDAGLFGEDETREVFIAADEFNDFFGNNILEFVSMLGVLWDFEGTYENKIKNGQSIRIPNPTISILGGTTPTTFNATFPKEIIGQGFFSRTIAVHAAPTGKKITWPYEPTEEERDEIVEYLDKIKTNHSGRVTLSVEATRLVDKIYQGWQNLEDVRFASYAGRRHIHLLKLILIITASRLGKQAEVDDVIYANTILHHTEQFMSQAYGEFGESRNSALTHKIMQILENTKEPLKMLDLWGKVQSDFDKMEPFTQLIQGMAHAGKILVHEGFLLPKRKNVKPEYNGVIDYSFLHPDEITK